jgi:hypothetical protein
MDILDIVEARISRPAATKVYLNPADARAIVEDVTWFTPVSPRWAHGELFATAAGLEWFTDETVPVGEKRLEP